MLVEKPLAPTPGEATRSSPRHASSGVPVLVETMHAHDPAFRAALPLITEARAVTIETVFGPNDAAIADATDLTTGRADMPTP